MADFSRPIASTLGQFDLTSWQGVGRLMLAIIVFFVIRLVYTAVYNLYFHPLRHIPGPPLWIAINGLRSLYKMRGCLEFKYVEFHEKYGEVVRVNADEVAFIRPEAWKDIYGHGHAEFPKHFPGLKMDTKKIVFASSKDHFRYRRAMLPAFSDKALRMQEPLISVYVNLLIKRLREKSELREPVDMVRWYNFTTFDLIADLAYGTSLQGLEKGKSNAWLDNIGNLIKLLPILAFTGMFPLVGSALKFLAGPQIRNAEKKHADFTYKMTIDRIYNKAQPDRGDFMDFMLRSRGEDHEMKDDELASNADLIMLAGSETTATLLSGVTYWLLRTPHALKRVVEEVRETFNADEEITFDDTRTKLPYMAACLQEGLRIFPPLPLGMLRCVPEGPPVQIAGVTIPGKTQVSVPQFAAYHSDLNFHRPNEFLPERWLPEAMSDPSSPFYNDRREVHRPFSVGRRDCIGQNLAMHEMRSILAKVLWNFDLTLDQSADGWHNQKILALWVKPPLQVHIKQRAK
ncbi:cytochrome protein [Xylaria bambusicola]|uniref:cytochrome protein n=1 Tax=Xylaria bambusicola TaxID=326684 RepID=UPI0020083426|nr:cytochrome protein [Xylaria bambusicola]KAI0528166.1 cytochrome protein [Xylaria bambusicola]